jgi:hypothetical protein
VCGRLLLPVYAHSPKSHRLFLLLSVYLRHRPGYEQCLLQRITHALDGLLDELLLEDVLPVAALAVVVLLVGVSVAAAIVFVAVAAAVVLAAVAAARAVAVARLTAGVPACAVCPVSVSALASSTPARRARSPSAAESAATPLTTPSASYQTQIIDVCRKRAYTDNRPQT